MSRTGPSSGAQDRPVPFIILTGFLGAGKTTVLNRLLGQPVRQRVAVLVNELGRIPIDGRLIAESGGDFLELSGGCVCCKVDLRGDLWRGVADIVDRSRPDCVVLETTGIAEPPALLDGLAALPPALAGRVTVAGVVCVVDAEACAAVLERRDEARVQLACADRVVLSKLDRAGADQVAVAHRMVGALAPEADRASFPASALGDRQLGEFVLGCRPAAAARGAGAGAGASARTAPHRHGQLVAACFADPAPLVRELLVQTVEQLRPALVRAKGFVRLAGAPGRTLLQMDGTELSLRPAGPWGGDPPGTELVFIGDGLDEAALIGRLWACRAAGP